MSPESQPSLPPATEPPAPPPEAPVRKAVAGLVPRSVLDFVRERWYALLRWGVRPFLRIKKVTPIADEPPFDSKRPVIYLIENHGLSNLLILDQACEEAGYPRPTERIPFRLARGKQRACVPVQKRSGWIFGRAQVGERSERLKSLLTLLNLERESDVQLVPVSIFLGRAPDRQSGWFKVLFSENWVVVGRLRRFLGILYNGRGTLVQFSKPVDLRQAIVEPLDLERDTRKFSRVLRVHFRRIRTAVIGPDLSHRRMLADSVISAPGVKAAIEALAEKEKIPLAKAYARAEKLLNEIAADYSHPFVRSAYFMLKRFWNRVYSGMRLSHFDQFKALAPHREVVYVPCHRSHIDYLVLSYLLYEQGMVVPHIAAGVNLNMFLVGPMLRRGGAFFMRRSFKNNALYTEVFKEYMAELMAQGFALEYFVEGGRSRTGRTLSPRAGLLAMTIRSFMREKRRPVVFQPVYIGYEKLIEGKSYLGELAGGKKEKESLLGVVRSGFGILKQRYGQVAVNFGEPIELSEVLDRHHHDWRNFNLEDEARPSWLPKAIDDVAQEIAVRINQAADVNPINLTALAILGTPKHAIGAADFNRVTSIAVKLLTQVPYSGKVTVTEKAVDDIAPYAESMRWIRRVSHPLGDVLVADHDEAILLTYYRNNVQHLFACVAWIACCLLNQRRIARQTVISVGRQVYPFLKTELFLPWSVDEFGQQLEQTIEFLEREGLVAIDQGSTFLARASDTDGPFLLRVFSHGLLQTFQRYYVVISILTKQGSSKLSSGELENLCHLTAQRIALLLELSGPEFFDRSLFKNFIQMLRELDYVGVDEENKLTFGTQLEQLGADARIVLSREMRQNVIKVSPD